MTFLLAAIALGFLGSFHCIGMCGPIALALPIHTLTPAKKTVYVLTYNSGRIFTYTVFGFFAGLIGKGFVIAGYQQILSVSLGILILLSVLLPLSFTSRFKFHSHLLLFFSRIKSILGKLFLKKGKAPLLMIGILNGLLPCGLVYMGIAGALATGDIFRGSLFMTAFGLGTLPAMLVLPLLGSSFDLKKRNTIRKAMPVITALVAVLLILRGLNLDIPYVSPKLEKQGSISACHTSQNVIYPKGLIKCRVPHKD